MAGSPLPYKNKQLPSKERAADLLSRMTLEEKVAQMLCLPDKFTFNKSGNLNDVEYDYVEVKKGLGQIAVGSYQKKAYENAVYTNSIQKMFIEKSRLGIPVIFHEEGLHGHSALDATSFPSAIAMASTWNPGLIQQVFTAVAKEMRTRGGHLALTPVLDLCREPRWGRAEETYGEDPYLVSRMGIACITGFQGDNPDSIDKQHVAATTKHFAAHGSPENGINISPPNIDERTLYETILVPFRAAVREANVRAVMASYNEFNGIPVHADKYLLTKVLRHDLGFNGIVVSDWFAVNQLKTIHFVCETEADCALKAVTATVDIELPAQECYQELERLVKEGRLDESVIDASVKRLLTMKFELGLFDDPYTDPGQAERITGCAEHRQLSLKTALESVVLLKNDKNLLPIDMTKIKTIAVIGPNADQCLIGNYSRMPKQIITTLDGIKKRAGGSLEILYSPGVKLTGELVNGEDEITLADPVENERLINEAVITAAKSDMVILVLGANPYMMREGWQTWHRGDNASLELRSSQNQLVSQVLKTGKPVAACVFSGGPLAFEYLSESVPALLQCWYLGQETGDAIASILFGDTNPSGKLPVSIPRSAGHLPVFYNHKPSSRLKGYLFDKTSPLYPFGYGLSYTSFSYSLLKLEKSAIKKTEDVKVFVTIENKGGKPGFEIAQLYIRDMYSSCTRPVKELKDFKKVFLNPGEKQTVEFLLNPGKLAFYNRLMEFVVEPGEFQIMVGSSSADEDLKNITLTVVE